MKLADHPGHPRPIAAHYHEHVFGVIVETDQIHDNFDMGQALNTGAHLILALDDQYPLGFEDALRLNRSPDVQLEYRIMPLIF